MDKRLEEELKALHAQIEELNSFHKCLTNLQVRISEYITYIDDRIRALEKKLE
jgi:prefoldin subunit 5